MSRRRRWWLRLAVAIVALVVTVLIMVQIFIWTDYPRQIAQTQLQRILRVQVSIGEVRVGWLGQTRIENVKLMLPMEDQPFAEIDSIDANHTTLLMLAFSQDLHRASARGVRIHLREDAGGRWNIQHFSNPSSAKASATSHGESTDLGTILRQIPETHLREASLSVTRADGKTFVLDPIELDLTSDSALTAELDAKLGPTMRANGRIAMTSAAAHEITFDIDSMPAGLAAFLGVDLPEPLSASMNWTGRKTPDGVSGRLAIREANVAAAHASGTIDVDAGSAVIAKPAGLIIRVEGAEPLVLEIGQGQIRYDKQLTLQAVRGKVNGGRFVLDGTVDLASYTSDLRATMENIRRKNLTLTGSAHVTSNRDYAGLVTAELALIGSAALPEMKWSGSINMDGSGLSRDNFTSRFTLSPLTVDRSNENDTISIPGIEGSVRGIDKRAELRNVHFTDASLGTLRVDGGVIYDGLEWWMTADAKAVMLDVVRKNALASPVDLSIKATGTKDNIVIEKLFAASGPATVWAEGFYDFKKPRPLNLSTQIWFDKPVTEDDHARLNSLEARGVLEGTLSPRDLSFEAEVQGTQLMLRDKELGDVALNVTANINQRSARVRAREMEIIGGIWNLKGDWSFADKTAPRIEANFRQIPFANIGELINVPELRGTIDRGTIVITAPSSKLNDLVATASMNGSDLRLSNLHADTLTLEAILKDGAFDLRPTLREEAGVLSVMIQGDVEMENPLSYQATLSDWPVPLPSEGALSAAFVDALASGSAKGMIRLDERGIVGETSLTAAIDQNGQSVFAVDVDASASRQRIDLAEINLKTPNGDLSANGTIHLDDLNRTTFDAEFARLDFFKLDVIDPIFRDLNGRFSGTLSVHPSTGERPLGKVTINIALKPTDAKFRSIQIGDASMTAFATYVSKDQFRFVTESAEIRIADGVVKPFARFSSQSDGVIGQLVTLEFENLDLDQLQRALDDDGKPVQGRLAGNVQIYGVANSINTTSGAAIFRITKSDLANFGPISALYNVLSVGTAGSMPVGEGRVEVRLEAGVLRIQEGQYFNRGVDARAYGKIVGLGNLETAKIDDVIVIGSLQPLRAIKLPFFGDLNDIVSAVQSSVTAIKVSGPLTDPKVDSVNLTALGGTLRRLLGEQPEADK